MNILKLICFFLLFGFYSCGQSTKKNKINSKAIKLFTEASKLMVFVKDIDSSKKALSLLDSSTIIEPDYYLGHFNKLVFLNRLKQFDKAVVTAGNLIRLRPNAHDLYIVRGVFSEKIGDTISSSKDFLNSLKICNSVLDTMNLRNPDYEMIMINKGVNLILLERNSEANILLKKISKN